MHFSDYLGFERQLGKFCGKGTKCNLQEEPRYGNYSSFIEAANACKKDTSCNMVMDHSCDDQGPYELCMSLNTCHSGQGTCSYKKPGEQYFI